MAEVVLRDAAREALERLEATLPAVRLALHRLESEPRGRALGTKKFVGRILAGVRATPVGVGRLHVFWRPAGDDTIVVLDIHDLPA